MKKMLFAWVFFVWAAMAFGQVLTNDERKFVIEMLNTNSIRFLSAIGNVSELQWTYKPTSESWSIAEVSEHIVLSDGLLLSIAQRSLKSPGDSSKGVELHGKENVVIAKLKDRTYRAHAPESLKPNNKFATKKELMEAFTTTRERTAFYVATTNDSLKDHIAAHPLFGELTTYQWLVMIPAHANRHVDQLEEVKAAEDFPLK